MVLTMQAGICMRNEKTLEGCFFIFSTITTITSSSSTIFVVVLKPPSIE